MSPLIGIYASEMSANLWEPQGAYDSLASVTVGSTSLSSITFAGIPSGYKHLQIRALILNNATGGINIQYNGDTGSNYTYHQLYGIGSGNALANAGTSQTSGFIAYNNAVGSFPTVAVVDILDYQNTNKYKTHRSLAGTDVNGAGGALTYFSGLWLNTFAISSITILGTFLTNTNVALYGVK